MSEHFCWRPASDSFQHRRTPPPSPAFSTRPFCPDDYPTVAVIRSAPLSLCSPLSPPPSWSSAHRLSSVTLLLSAISIQPSDQPPTDHPPPLTHIAPPDSSRPRVPSLEFPSPAAPAICLPRWGHRRRRLAPPPLLLLTSHRPLLLLPAALLLHHFSSSPRHVASNPAIKSPLAALSRWILIIVDIPQAISAQPRHRQLSCQF